MGPSECNKSGEWVLTEIPVHIELVYMILYYMKDGLSVLQGKGTFLVTGTVDYPFGKKGIIPYLL